MLGPYFKLATIGCYWIEATPVQCGRHHSTGQCTSCAVTLCDPTRPLCPWNSPGKNTRVGCHALLPGITSTQGLNPGLHCRSHQGRALRAREAPVSAEVMVKFIHFVLDVRPPLPVEGLFRGYASESTDLGSTDFPFNADLPSNSTNKKTEA